MRLCWHVKVWGLIINMSILQVLHQSLELLEPNKSCPFLSYTNVWLHWHIRLHSHWSVIVSNLFHVPTGTTVIKQIHHALTGHYTSPNSTTMRNQVLWKNPYALPIITFEESDRERNWIIDCCTQSNVFKRKDFRRGSHSSDDTFVFG